MVARCHWEFAPYRTDVVNKFTGKLETTEPTRATCSTNQRGSYTLVANKLTTSRGKLV